MESLDVVDADLLEDRHDTSALSTFSAMVATCMARPILAMASTMLRSTGSVATWAANWPSILRKSTGRVLRYENDDTPLPKSSSAEAAAARLELAHEEGGLGE